MGREASAPGMSPDVISELSRRLSHLPSLHLPHALGVKGDQVTAGEKEEYLAGLLERDPGVFLERYATDLSSEELNAFDPLADDYVISWHLQNARTALASRAASSPRSSATVRNRRYAFMTRLLKDGEYFSEDAMRLRAPALYTEYMGDSTVSEGQGRDQGEGQGRGTGQVLGAPSTSGSAWAHPWALRRPGERIWETLLRQSDNAEAWGHMERARQSVEVEEEEEEEPEEEEDGDEAVEQEEGKVEAAASASGASFTEENGVSGRRQQPLGSLASLRDSGTIEGVCGSGIEHSLQETLPPGPVSGNGGGDPGTSSTLLSGEGVLPDTVHTVATSLASTAGSPVHDPQPSPIRTVSSLGEFRRVMEERFMAGEDRAHVDYAAIDMDATLDDDWLLEQGRDAEERYFEDD